MIKNHKTNHQVIGVHIFAIYDNLYDTNEKANTPISPNKKIHTNLFLLISLRSRLLIISRTIANRKTDIRLPPSNCIIEYKPNARYTM